MGFDHIDFLEASADVRLKQKHQDSLRLAYVLLSSYYFLLDATVDDHLDDKLDVLFLTHLLEASLVEIWTVVIDVDPTLSPRLARLLHQHVAENAAAIRLEQKLASRPQETSPTDDLDKACATGRSNSVLFFYRLLCLVGARRPTQEVEEVIQEAIFLIQQGDDYSDWHADFLGNRSTPFLRFCFNELNRADTSITEETLQEFIYLGYGSEFWIGQLLRQLEALETRVAEQGNNLRRLQAFVKKYRLRAMSGLRTFLKRKQVLKEGERWCPAQDLAH